MRHSLLALSVSVAVCGGCVHTYQVNGTKLEKKTPWFHGYRDIIQQMIATSA